MFGVQRQLKKEIKNRIFKGKTLLLIGQRQVGKTTLIKEILSEYDDHILFDGDDIATRQLFSENNTAQLRRAVGHNRIVFIDEAQRINNIGISAKIIHDQFKDIQLILSGSSALELNSSIQESLTGRVYSYNLYPFSWNELSGHFSFIEMEQQLNDRLIYGMYPDVINNKGEEIDVLKNLAESYMYRDILALSNIKKPEVLEKLVIALAYQIGSQVSYNELANMLQVNKETVSNYIDLLEKAFIIFRLKPFSRNLRNEIKSKNKIYFYDNGIRNAVIRSFNSIDLRPDKGALWENFLISERIKMLSYNRVHGFHYFWRNKDQQEVDWLEERDGKLSAFEFKWNAKQKYRFPGRFMDAYQPSTEIIHRDNFYDFVEGVKGFD